MRIGSVILVIWLVIGLIAAAQRNYFNDKVTCASAGTIVVTVVRPAQLRRSQPQAFLPREVTPVYCSSQRASAQSTLPGPGPGGDDRAWAPCAPIVCTCMSRA